MSSYRSRSAIWVAVFLAATSLGSQPLFAQVSAADHQTAPSIPAQEQPEVLSRGPVHEAFAEPVIIQLQTDFIAPQQPPLNITEVPPAEKPQGAQFVWIPGYWAWDAERSGYIWVSACWRAAPPKMSWVPGYWVQVSGGWKWIAGYWASATAKEIVYMPTPPPAIEDLEPVTIQPSPDMIWVPPCMYWSHGQYIRRAGYWLAAQPDWLWVPSHYVVTPRGYIFAEGHWDYSLERRGVLFAPVYFPSSVYLRAGFTFSPGIVIDMGLLQVSLFAYPRYRHYYFGDYYDHAYLSVGIFPWFESHRRHSWYDPVYEHARWHHRSDLRWEEHERDQYSRLRDDKTLRPAHTFHEQESRGVRLSEPQRRAVQLVRPIGEPSASGRKTSQKFEKIDNDTRQKISKQAVDVHKFSDDRNHWESPRTGAKTTQPSGERKFSDDRNRGESSATGIRTAQPSGERRAPVKTQVKQNQTIQPVEVNKTTVTPSVDYRKTVQPAGKREATVTPAIEQRQIVEPQKKTGGALTVPDSQREHTVSPHRETQNSRPERIQVPTSPVIGNSGRQGFFRKGMPAQPADESKDSKDNDFRRR